MEQEAKSGPVEAPRGIFQARVDDKGRLKLPAAFHKFLEGSGEEKVFITSVDLRMARIYPISVWKQNEIFLDEFRDDPEAAEDVAFIANDLGADSAVDSNGRVLIPTELRRQIGIENQPVWLDYYKGRINVYGQQIYEARKRRAMDNLQAKLQSVERNGFR